MPSDEGDAARLASALGIAGRQALRKRRTCPQGATAGPSTGMAAASSSRRWRGNRRHEQPDAIARDVGLAVGAHGAQGLARAIVDAEVSDQSEAVESRP